MPLTGRMGRAAAAAFLVVGLGTGIAVADPLSLAEPMHQPGTWPFGQGLQEQQTPDPGEDATAELPPALRRQVVAYPTGEPIGTIVIDTPRAYLYLVLGGGTAMRYGIGVGREGFTWSGIESVVRKAEWPDWYPPAEMLARQPYLPRVMAGGPGNPLGARALYLGNTQYRIHGTNQPQTIGQHVSSGCIRMLNADVVDLYDRVPIGAKVVVLSANGRQDRSATSRAHNGRTVSAAIPVSAPAAAGPAGGRVVNKPIKAPSRAAAPVWRPPQFSLNPKSSGEIPIRIFEICLNVSEAPLPQAWHTA
jgi:lipoprotein-anchoring transpeptidase ErfK/SrfK